MEYYRLCSVAVVAALLVLATACAPAPPPDESTPVAFHYYEAGPHEVVMEDNVVPGTEAGATPNVDYTIFRPATLSDTEPHPIITMGIGFGGACAPADSSLVVNANPLLMSHLASYGYVVICANTSSSPHDFWGFFGLGSAQSGIEMLAAARYMVDQNSNEESPYYQRLDTTKVGAFGSSGGACGAPRATLASEGLITSTLVHAYIEPLLVNLGCGGNTTDWGALTTPIFFLGGNADPLAWPATTTAKYDLVTNAPAAKVIGVGDSHGVNPESYPYLVAWFDYTLRGDSFAASAFVSDDPVVAEAPAVTAGGASLPSCDLVPVQFQLFAAGVACDPMLSEDPAAMLEDLAETAEDPAAVAEDISAVTEDISAVTEELAAAAEDLAPLIQAPAAIEDRTGPELTWNPEFTEFAAKGLTLP